MVFQKLLFCHAYRGISIFNLRTEFDSFIWDPCLYFLNLTWCVRISYMFVLVNYMSLFEFICEVFDCIKLREYFSTPSLAHGDHGEISVSPS